MLFLLWMLFFSRICLAASLFSSSDLSNSLFFNLTLRSSHFLWFFFALVSEWVQKILLTFVFMSPSICSCKRHKLCLLSKFFFSQNALRMGSIESYVSKTVIFPNHFPTLNAENISSVQISYFLKLLLYDFPLLGTSNHNTIHLKVLII